MNGCLVNPGDEIGREEWLYRRVYRTDRRYIHPNTGVPLSRAFTPRPKDEGRLSVDLARLTSPQISVHDTNRFALFQLNSSVPIDLGLSCIYDPLPAQGEFLANAAHTLIQYIDPEDEIAPGWMARCAQKVVC